MDSVLRKIFPGALLLASVVGLVGVSFAQTTKATAVIAGRIIIGDGGAPVQVRHLRVGVNLLDGVDFPIFASEPRSDDAFYTRIVGHHKIIARARPNEAADGV